MAFVIKAMHAWCASWRFKSAISLRFFAIVIICNVVIWFEFLPAVFRGHLHGAGTERLQRLSSSTLCTFAIHGTLFLVFQSHLICLATCLEPPTISIYVLLDMPLEVGPLSILLLYQLFLVGNHFEFLELKHIEVLLRLFHSVAHHVPKTVLVHYLSVGQNVTHLVESHDSILCIEL